MDQEETANPTPRTAQVIFFPVRYRQGENQTADWFRSLRPNTINGIIPAGDDE